MASNCILKRGDIQGEKQWYTYRLLWGTMTQSATSSYPLSDVGVRVITLREKETPSLSMTDFTILVIKNIAIKKIYYRF